MYVQEKPLTGKDNEFEVSHAPAPNTCSSVLESGGSDGWELEADFPWRAWE